MEQMDEMRTIGKLMQDIRETRKVTRQELAGMVECRYDEIRLYETGGRIMRVDRFFRILEVLGIPVRDSISNPEICQAAVQLSALRPELRKAMLGEILAVIRKTWEQGRNSPCDDEGIPDLPSST